MLIQTIQVKTIELCELSVISGPHVLTQSLKCGPVLTLPKAQKVLIFINFLMSKKFLFFSDLFSYSQSMRGLHQFIAQRI